jgi:hypothetical protein
LNLLHPLPRAIIVRGGKESGGNERRLEAALELAKGAALLSFVHMGLEGQGNLGGALRWQVVGRGEQGLGNFEALQVSTLSAETSAFKTRLEQSLGVQTTVLSESGILSGCGILSGVQVLGVGPPRVQLVSSISVGLRLEGILEFGRVSGTVTVGTSILVWHVENVLCVRHGVRNRNRVGHGHGLRNGPVNMDDLGNGHGNVLLNSGARNDDSLLNGDVLDHLNGAVNELGNFDGAVDVLGHLNGTVDVLEDLDGTIDVFGDVHGAVNEFGNLNRPVDVLGDLDWAVDVLGHLNRDLNLLLDELGNFNRAVDVFGDLIRNLNLFLDELGNFNGTVDVLGHLNRDVDGLLNDLGDLNGVGTVNVDDLLLGNGDGDMMDLGPDVSDNNGTRSAAHGNVVVENRPGGDAEGRGSQGGSGEETSGGVDDWLRARHQIIRRSGRERDRGKGSAGDGVGSGGNRQSRLLIGQDVVVAVKLGVHGGGDESLLLVDGKGRLGIISGLNHFLDGGDGHDGSGLSHGQVSFSGLHNLRGRGLEEGGNSGNGSIVHNRCGGGVDGRSVHGGGGRGEKSSLVGVGRGGAGGSKMVLSVVNVLGQLVGDGRVAGGGNVVQGLVNVSLANLGGGIDAHGEVSSDAAGGCLVDGGWSLRVGFQGSDGAVTEGEAG